MVWDSTLGRTPIDSSPGDGCTPAVVIAALLVTLCFPCLNDGFSQEVSGRWLPSGPPKAAQSEGSAASRGNHPARVFAAEKPQKSSRPSPVRLTSASDAPQLPTEELPPPLPRSSIGVGGSSAINLAEDNGLVSLVARDASLKEILAALSKTQNFNLIFPSELDSQVTISLAEVPWRTAFNTLLAVTGYTAVNQNGIILVTDASAKLAPSVQGRRLQVFELNFASAVECDLTVKGLLSQVGQSFVSESSPIDNLRTKELLVVEDTPEYLERIASYIAQVDQPPRQVLIETHILEVELRGDMRHGVNFEALASLVDPRLSIRTQGFANPLAPQAFIVELDGERMDALLEALKTTTDAKTLASPRILALNGQESRIQIGEQLGFRVVTTTETSTLESVDFIDVGVVLRVLARISHDGRVLLHVMPEVSTGQVNPDTGLPEEETTELQTDVLLADGQGIVLGGLIREELTNVQSKVPVAGDIPWVGAMFQRRQVVRSRSEIVIALIPRVVPCEPFIFGRDAADLDRATTPLFDGPLHDVPRPFEPRLPDPLRRAEEAYWRLQDHHLPPVSPGIPPTLQPLDRLDAPVVEEPPHNLRPAAYPHPRLRRHSARRAAYLEDAPPRMPSQKAVRFTITDE